MSSAWPKVSVGSSPEEFAWHLQDAAVRCSAVLLEVSLSRGHQKHTSLPAITPGGRTMRRRCRSFHCRASLSPSRTGAQNVDACYQHSYKTLSRGPCTIASWPVAQMGPLNIEIVAWHSQGPRQHGECQPTYTVSNYGLERTL